MIKIKVTSKKGVDFDQYMESYFSDFVTSGWPYFLGGDSQYDGSQIVLLDDIASKPSKTKSLVLDGKDFFYYFSDHTLSGKLTSVSLATLGKSYNAKDGSFDTNKKGEITGIKTAVKISGLDISNPVGERGELHDTVYALMGGAHDGGGISDPSLLIEHMNAEAQKFIGSKGNDKYSGTEHGDKIKGKDGNDVLYGKGGKDKIVGQDGNDKLYGGADADVLKGGKGKDAFVFDTELGPVDKIKDFKSKDDVIWLSDDVFTGLGTGKLSKSAFVEGAGPKDDNDRVGYDSKTGAVWYDPDGNGSGETVVFAQLKKGLDIGADDFLVV